MAQADANPSDGGPVRRPLEGGSRLTSRENIGPPLAEYRADPSPPVRAEEMGADQEPIGQRLQEATDELLEMELECVAVWGENERLKTELSNLRYALERLELELAGARHLIQAMEATRGWRLLTFLRRCRNAVRRWIPGHDRRLVNRAAAAYRVLDEGQAKVFREQTRL